MKCSASGVESIHPILLMSFIRSDPTHPCRKEIGADPSDFGIGGMTCCRSADFATPACPDRRHVSLRPRPRSSSLAADKHRSDRHHRFRSTLRDVQAGSWLAASASHHMPDWACYRSPNSSVKALVRSPTAMPAHQRPIVIIGTGGIVADAHLPAYRKAGFQIAGLYDRDGAKASSLAATGISPGSSLRSLRPSRAPASCSTPSRADCWGG